MKKRAGSLDPALRQLRQLPAALPLQRELPPSKPEEADKTAAEKQERRGFGSDVVSLTRNSADWRPPDRLIRARKQGIATNGYIRPPRIEALTCVGQCLRGTIRREVYLRHRTAGKTALLWLIAGVEVVPRRSRQNRGLSGGKREHRPKGKAGPVSEPIHYDIVDGDGPRRVVHEKDSTVIGTTAKPPWYQDGLAVESVTDPRAWKESPGSKSVVITGVHGQVSTRRRSTQQCKCRHQNPKSCFHLVSLQVKQ